MASNYTNNLSENVNVTRAVIEVSDKELAELKTRIAQQEEEYKMQESTIRTCMGAIRAELLRQIEDANNQEETELQTLAVLHAKKRAPLVEKRNSLKRIIEVNLAAIAPIRKIPPEILGLIFQAYVALDESPWFLATISRSWRRISLSTPSLWVYLAIAEVHNGFFSMYPELSRRYWKVDGEQRVTDGKRLCCRDPEEFQILASRSGNVPLDIRLDQLPYGKEGKILQALFGSYLSSRIGSLDIQDCLLPDDLHGLKLGPFPHLHHLSALYTPSILWALGGSTPLLGLILEGLGSPAKRDDASQSSHTPNSLRSLALNPLASQPVQFNQIIRSLANLETLSGCPKFWPDISTSITTFPRLSSISVECKPEDLARIRLPSLKTLTWTNLNLASEPPSIMADSYGRDWHLSFPQVTTISVEMLEASWLARLSAPLLREITCRYQAFEPASTSLPGIRIPSVERFSMCSTCPDDALVAALACFPNALEVSLSPGAANTHNRMDNWGLGLLKSLADADMAFGPNLRSLTLGAHNFPAVDALLGPGTLFMQTHRVETSKTLAKPLINAVIKSRRKRGVPLQRFEIAWTKRKGKSETIQYV